MKKKILLGLMVGILELSSVLTVFASPRVMPDGTVFDWEYYKDNNPDVVAAIGDSEELLYQHYTLFGKAEGRKPYSDDIADTANNVPVVESRINCLTTELPVFSPEVRMRNNLLVPVVFDALDGHYLAYTEIYIRYYFGLDGSRKDYSKDPIYLAIRDYIIEELTNNKDCRDINIPIIFIPKNAENSDYFINMINNLEIDLNKSAICDRALFMGTNPVGAISHDFEHEERFFCNVEWYTPEEMFNEHLREEVPINPETGLPFTPKEYYQKKYPGWNITPVY